MLQDNTRTNTARNVRNADNFEAAPFNVPDHSNMFVKYCFQQMNLINTFMEIFAFYPNKIQLHQEIIPNEHRCGHNFAALTIQHLTEEGFYNFTVTFSDEVQFCLNGYINK